MASAAASTSTSTPSPAQQTLYARLLLAQLHLWPALRLALQYPSQPSAPGKAEESVKLFASELLELFVGARGAAPEEEAVEEVLLQVMDEEFDTLVDDDSALSLARSLILGWKSLADPEFEQTVRLLEERADQVGKQKLQVRVREDVEEVSDDEGEEEEEGEEDVVMDEAPQLVERQRAERVEPVVDEEGFTLVQKKGRR